MRLFLEPQSSKQILQVLPAAIRKVTVGIFAFIGLVSTASGQTTTIPRLRTIESTGSVGTYTSLTSDANNYIAVSYTDQTLAMDEDLKLWLDDGAGGGIAGNEIADGLEVRTIDSTGRVGTNTSIALDANNRLAISYLDFGNGDLKLWIDDGTGGGTAGDGQANGLEIRIIESAGFVGVYSSITVDVNGRLAISYLDGSNLDLKLWLDDGQGGGTAGDGQANGTEIRLIDQGGQVGEHSTIAIDGNGRLAIGYYDGTNLDFKLWVDDGVGGGTAGDGVANGNEIRVIDSSGSVGRYVSLAKDVNGILVASYLDATTGDLKLWVDDGAAGGTAGDGQATGSEIRTIDSVGNVGAYTSVGLDPSGRLMVSYQSTTSMDLKAWIDDGAGGGTAGNGIADGTEIQSIDTTGDVGTYTSTGVDTKGRVVISYADETNDDLKLAILQNYEPRSIDESGTVGSYTSIITDANGYLAVSYHSGQLEVWIDDGSGGGIAGDGQKNGSEIRTIDSSGLVGLYSSITLDASSRLAVSYYDSTNGDLKLWLDDGRTGGTAGDGIANGSEVRTIDSADSVGTFSSITLDVNNRLAISYYDGTNNSLKLWVDDGAGGGTAGDGLANGSEIRTIDNSADVGQYSSITIDANGRLAVSYYDTDNGNLKLWLDDGRLGGTADDALANGSEIRNIDSFSDVGMHTSIALDGNDFLAISYYDFSNGNLKLWVDDGSTGGTAGDGIANGAEVRVIDSTDNIGLYTSIVLGTDDHLAISYYDFDKQDLKLWVDDGANGGVPGDSRASGSEVRTIDSGDDEGQHTAIAVDSEGHFAISYRNNFSSSLRLFYIVSEPEINVTGNGSSILDGDSTPSATDDTDFGTINVGSTTSNTFTVLNSGFTGLRLTGNPRVSISGASFSVTTEPAAYIAGSGGTTFVIEFAPLTPGLHTGTVTISNGDSDENPYNFTIQGEALGPEISVSGNSNNISDGDVTPSVSDDTNFGTIAAGTVEDNTFTIVNVGTFALTLDGIPLVSVSGSSAFSVTTQPSSSVLPASGGTASFVVRFAPSAAGLETATISIASDDPDEDPFTFSVQGTGVVPEMDVSGNGNSIADGDVSPSATDDTDFGTLNVNTNDSNTFTVTNSGSAILNLDGTPRVVVSGSTAFTVTSQPGATVGASGGTTTFIIQFAPTADGVEAATVSIANDDPNEDPYNFSVRGVGLDPLDTDGDGIRNAIDPDDDNDGVSDIQEGADGTNPLDPGSFIQILGTTLCSEWNGFFSGSMWNIMEHVNTSGSTRNFVTTLFDINGAAQSTFNGSILTGAQSDVLVQDMPGRINNSYGRVCSVQNGAAGDVDGRMVYYKPTNTGFDFAFALPFQNGIIGSQFVLFNTYQPSLDPVDASNFVANWVQVTNLDTVTRAGTLYYYAQDGSVLATDSISLAAGARRDFSGHQFGANLVGMIEWRPDNLSAPFQLRVIRYYYDNQTLVESFDSAFQLDGLKGSGEVQVVHLDTRDGTAVLEVANTQPTSQNISVRFYSSTGALLQTIQVSLPAYGSVHLIADSILVDSLGSAWIDGSAAGGVIATAMQYGRTPSTGIKYVYGIQAREALGTELAGSYNTFLSQGCDLLLTEADGVSTSASVSLRRFDGTLVLNNQTVNLSAHGTATLDLCTNDQADVYGVVRVSPAINNSIVANVLRKGPNDDYRFPTPVRQ